MFIERRIICIYLIFAMILPFLEKTKDIGKIMSWIISSCLLCIFPFLSATLKDTSWQM